MVSAVEDEVVLRDDFLGILWREMSGMSIISNSRVQPFQRHIVSRIGTSSSRKEKKTSPFEICHGAINLHHANPARRMRHLSM